MIAFTICSNNYLSEAITLGNSLVKTGFQTDNFLIFLVDKFHQEIKYDLIPFKVIEISEEIVPGFENISTRYNIVELNTAVKPSIFKHLISSFNSENFFVYLDPDLYFYENINESLVKEIGDDSILLTPHILQPLELDQIPFENNFLNYGIYNLGFIALKADDNSSKMLDWWEIRTMNLGTDDVSKGLFVDQLWINLVPIFFKGIKISRHPGLNAAYWNNTERSINKVNDTYFVNGSYPLIFFHFSSFDITLTRISKRNFKQSNVETESLRKLMQLYKNDLEENNYTFYKKFKPYYKISFNNYCDRFLPGVTGEKVLLVKKYINILPTNIIGKFANLHHILTTLKNY